MTTKPKHIRSRIKPLTRYLIYGMDNYECVYCGSNLRQVTARERTLDHVRPASKLGHRRYRKEVNHAANLVTCCVPCNNRFGNTCEGKHLQYGRYRREAV